MMDEKRKEKRLKEENEVIITIASGDCNPPAEKKLHNCSKDLSASGVKIHGKAPLPVDTLLNIDFTLESLHQKITTSGKVKWIKIINEDDSYDEGVEFVNTSEEAMKILKDYISWKLKSDDIKPFQISAEIKETESKR